MASTISSIVADDSVVTTVPADGDNGEDILISFCCCFLLGERACFLRGVVVMVGVDGDSGTFCATEVVPGDGVATTAVALGSPALDCLGDFLAGVVVVSAADASSVTVVDADSGAFSSMSSSFSCSSSDGGSTKGHSFSGKALVGDASFEPLGAGLAGKAT